MKATPENVNKKGGVPVRLGGVWAGVLLGVLALALFYQWLTLMKGWDGYVQSWNAVLACGGDKDCLVVAADALLRKLNKGVVLLYFLFFALFECVPVLNSVLRIVGCLLFPVFGQVFLAVRHCWIYMVVGAAGMAVGEHYWTTFGEYAFGGMFSAFLMLVRIVVLREKSPYQGAIWDIARGMVRR